MAKRDELLRGHIYLQYSVCRWTKNHMWSLDLRSLVHVHDPSRIAGPSGGGAELITVGQMLELHILFRSLRRMILGGFGRIEMPISGAD